MVIQEVKPFLSGVVEGKILMFSRSSFLLYMALMSCIRNLAVKSYVSPAFLGGLYSGGAYIRGAYIRRAFCVSVRVSRLQNSLP